MQIQSITHTNTNANTYTKTYTKTNYTYAMVSTHLAPLSLGSEGFRTQKRGFRRCLSTRIVKYLSKIKGNS